MQYGPPDPHARYQPAPHMETSGDGYLPYSPLGEDSGAGPPSNLLPPNSFPYRPYTHPRSGAGGGAVPTEGVERSETPFSFPSGDRQSSPSPGSSPARPRYDPIAANRRNDPGAARPRYDPIGAASGNPWDPRRQYPPPSRPPYAPGSSPSHNTPSSPTYAPTSPAYTGYIPTTVAYSPPSRTRSPAVGHGSSGGGQGSNASGVAVAAADDPVVAGGYIPTSAAYSPPSRTQSPGGRRGGQGSDATDPAAAAAAAAAAVSYFPGGPRGDGGQGSDATGPAAAVADDPVHPPAGPEAGGGQGNDEVSSRAADPIAEDEPYNPWDEALQEFVFSGTV